MRHQDGALAPGHAFSSPQMTSCARVKPALRKARCAAAPGVPHHNACGPLSGASHSPRGRQLHCWALHGQRGETALRRRTVASEHPALPAANLPACHQLSRELGCSHRNSAAPGPSISAAVLIVTSAIGTPQAPLMSATIRLASGAVEQARLAAFEVDLLICG